MRPSVTLEDLSGRLAVRGLYIDRTSLGRIERQERSVFDFEIIAIAKALRVPLVKLFGITDA
jgi:transcriptional regulator with XRE-family HTH domain